MSKRLFDQIEDEDRRIRRKELAELRLGQENHEVSHARLPWVPREGHPVLEMFVLVLPRRLYIEDLGDALETLARLERRGDPGWKSRLKAASICILLLLNAIREVVSALRGNAGSGPQGKGDRR